MEQVVMWALGTGLVTGGVWVAIVLHGRQRWLRQQYEAMHEVTEDRLRQLDDTIRRVAELEERLDFAERLLANPERSISEPREP